MEDFLNHYNFNKSLSSSINTRFLEEFEGKNEDKTVY